MLAIRPYRTEDRSRVEHICLAGSDPAAQNPAFQAAVLEVFCQYYLEQEPENCFVAVNEQDEAAGYILCAKDFCTWEQLFDERYLQKMANEISKIMGKATIEILRPYAAEYPAHLHIDIHPDYQKRGLGTQLMDALRLHLTGFGVRGLLLNVGKDNEGGRRFYQRYGFSELKEGAMEVVMGLKLS